MAGSSEEWPISYGRVKCCKTPPEGIPRLQAFISKPLGSFEGAGNRLPTRNGSWVPLEAELHFQTDRASNLVSVR